MRNAMIVLALLLASCRGEHVEKAASTPITATTATTTANAPQSLIVRGANGLQALAINESAGAIEIDYENHKLHGETRDSGKRKYHIDSGAVLFEVKPGDDGGFKLRTADGTLRWKVKVTPEKIKISDNEQNANPFELKAKEGDRTKVVAPGEKELGNVRFDRAKGKLEVENAGGVTQFTVDTTTPSGAYGVLLLDSIPVAQRYILLAELRSRGK